MSNSNPLLGLLSSYGDSDEDSEDEALPIANKVNAVSTGQSVAPSIDISTVHAAGIHPAPIPHCQWSACYDESSGCTYYWNQQTNAVTWDAPPEYLLALKLAQQQLHSAGSTEVSAEEWQLYQQALVEKQNAPKKVVSKLVAIKPAKNIEKVGLGTKQKNGNKKPVKRKNSSDEDEKIELITSYHNSDSESNEESETPVIPVEVAKPVVKPKYPHKKQKTKPQVIEYGPSLPSDQNYAVPIGPELPPNLITEEKPPELNKSPEHEKENDVAESNEEIKSTPVNDAEDIQDDDDLLKKLKDKAKLLEKLGGEIPSELQKIIEEETSRTASPVKSIEENSRDSKVTTEANIDELLEEIEKKEFPKLVKSQEKESIDMFDNEDTKKCNGNSTSNSPKSSGIRTPPLEELKALFPKSKTVDDETPKTLFPSAVNIQENDIKVEPKPGTPPIVEASEKKGANLYIMDVSEPRENTIKKKRRIDNTVLPARKVNEAPAYTTKYSQYIEGFTGERTGLGFSKDDATESDSQKETVSYGNGLTFTKGETLNEEKKDEALDDLTDLVEAKLKFLCQQQLCSITPVQEMLIQMQTLGSAFRAGSLAATYWRRWTEAAHVSLAQHEAIAAPPGWTCTFHRSEGRYRYVREVDGLAQWEYPAVTNTDMEICTTPPPPPPPPEHPVKCEDPPPRPMPPLPPEVPQPPPPPSWSRVATPPPPRWADPPPPGTDERSHTPPEPKKEIGDELMSFYNDLAELENTHTHTSEPATASNSPEATEITKVKVKAEEKTTQKIKIEEKNTKTREETGIREEKEKSQVKDLKTKKKSKVKITSSIGMKQKTVTSLVAKWQQVAEEINSD